MVDELKPKPWWVGMQIAGLAGLLEVLCEAFRYLIFPSFEVLDQLFALQRSTTVEVFKFSKVEDAIVTSDAPNTMRASCRPSEPSEHRECSWTSWLAF